MNRDFSHIYIDASNIIMSAKNIDFDLDIIKLVIFLKDKYKPDQIIFFVCNFNKYKKLFMYLRNIGVEIVTKDLYNENKKLKANCDVEISHRITRDIDFDLSKNIILVSGDGDFASLLDFVIGTKRKVKAIAMDKVSCSLMIKRRSYTNISYLQDLGEKIKNKKPPTNTEIC